MSWDLAVFSDTHMGAGDGSDDASYAAFDAMCDEVVSLGITDLVANGDWFELWEQPWDEIVAFNAERLDHLGLRLRANNVTLWYVLGNHDAGDPKVIARRLHDAGIRYAQVLAGPLELHGWHLEHGHRFDVWNNGGVLTPVAKGLTYATGLVEKIAPWFDQHAINPTKWVSGRRAPDLNHPIHRAANTWAWAERKRLIFGHTHHPYSVRGDGWAVVNSGHFTRGAGSYVLANAAGDVQIVRAGSLAGV